MSRFQLLIFTFVIAASLFLIVASKGPPDFPKIYHRGYWCYWESAQAPIWSAKAFRPVQKRALAAAVVNADRYRLGPHNLAGRITDRVPG